MVIAHAVEIIQLNTDLATVGVPRGYKYTESGYIPEEWSQHSVIDVIKEMTDYVAAGSFESLRNNVKVYDTPEYAIYVRLFDLRLGLGHPSQKYVNKNSYNFLSKSNLYGNEILIANIGANVGEVFLMPSNIGYATIAPNMIILRSDDKNVRFDYLFYYLRSSVGQRKLFEQIAGSGHPKLNKTDLKRVAVIVPPLSEQEAIAEALSDADALIESLDALIAKKRAIRQGAMQDLLSGRKRLPGFSGEWTTKRFGSLAAIRNQKVNTSGNALARFCVELENIGSSSGRLLAFSDATDRVSSKYSFQKGDVLFGRLRPYLRKFWQADRDGVSSTEIWPLIPTSDLLPDYLYQTVQTESFIEAASSSFGTHMPRSDWKALRDHEIALPTDTDEQQAISTILSEMDSEIASLEAEAEKARQIKQGMMHELLTGRVRLV